MRALLAAASLIGAAALLTLPVSAASCPNEADALGVARIVEIDAAGGPLFGDITKQRKEPKFLKRKEVVLTFDDGPMPRVTKPILDILDRFCTKATFFAVGEMALAYPTTLRDIIARGHTLGAHTWSHPNNLNRLRLAKAKDQIERGFAAVARAAGGPIAPFFRFPGLSDSRRLLAYLQGRGVASFTVDVVSDDSYISSPARLAKVTLRRIERNGGGIVLFHDIKRATAKALPVILTALKDRGYKVVHMRPKTKFKPLKRFNPGIVAAATKTPGRQQLSSNSRVAILTAAVKARGLPFYGTIGPGKYATLSSIGPPVATLSPPPRRRLKPVSVTSKKAAKAKPKIAPADKKMLGPAFGPLLPTIIEAQPLQIDLRGL